MNNIYKAIDKLKEERKATKKLEREQAKLVKVLNKQKRTAELLLKARQPIKHEDLAKGFEDLNEIGA